MSAGQGPDVDQSPPEHSEEDNPPLLPQRRWWQPRPRRVMVVAAALALAVVPWFLIRRSACKTASSRRPQSVPDDNDGGVRIPLKDVVRFKEQQWFLEELEASREGDPNAMLRLAKMYLHGQGCDKSMTMAHEWLRKARHLGLYCTLEELFAGEDWEATRAAAAAAARRALKQQELAAQRGGMARHYGAAARAHAGG